VSSEDFDIYNRSSQTIKVTVLDESGDHVHLTGLTEAVVTFKTNKDDPDTDAILQVKLTEGKIAVTNALLGELTISLDPTDMDITAARYFYDLVLYFASDQYTALYGEANVLERITD